MIAHCGRLIQPATRLQLARSVSSQLLLRMPPLLAHNDARPAGSAVVRAEYCERGSLTDVLHAAASNSALAAQLTWPRRLQLVRQERERRLPQPNQLLPCLEHSAAVVFRAYKQRLSPLRRRWVRQAACMLCTPTRRWCCTEASAALRLDAVAPPVSSLFAGQGASQAGCMHSAGSLAHPCSKQRMLPVVYVLQI